MSRKLRLIVFFIFIFVSILNASPGLMNYRGKLFESGAPVTGVKNMRFQIFNALTAGTMQWDSGTHPIHVYNGYYNITLGTNISIPASIFTNDFLYLEVTIEGTILSPRERLVTVPYAFSVADNSITTSKLADNSVNSSKIIDNTIVAQDIANNAITGSKIKTEAISNRHLSLDANSLYQYHHNNCKAGEYFVVIWDGTGLGLCFEINERAATTWMQAARTCANLGKRLPDYHEWRRACDGNYGGSAGSPNPNLNNMIGNWEWASSRPSSMYTTSHGAGSIIAGNADCANVANDWIRKNSGSETSYNFRCVR